MSRRRQRLLFKDAFEFSSLELLHSLALTLPFPTQAASASQRASASLANASKEEKGKELLQQRVMLSTTTALKRRCLETEDAALLCSNVHSSAFACEFARKCALVCAAKRTEVRQDEN